MQKNKITAEGLACIVERLVLNAKEAHDESVKDNNDLFKQGRRLAYYEMLDMLKTELEMQDADLREFGLDIDVDAFM